jgi:hypothetical protein
LKLAVNVEWGNPEQTIVVAHYEGKWTWEEFYHANTVDVVALMQSVPHTVHVISDMSASSGLPMGGAITNARNVINHYPANWGMLVVVSDKMIVSALVNVYHSAFKTGTGGKTFAAKTLEDAFALVQQEAGQQG